MKIFGVRNDEVRTVELYLEPSATLLSKKIAITPKNHPIESELKLTIGTKVRF